MIKLIQGDLLEQDDVDAIVNAVNCVGVMGKGIALQFKHRWPANFTEYTAACKAGKWCDCSNLKVALVPWSAAHVHRAS